MGIHRTLWGRAALPFVLFAGGLLSQDIGLTAQRLQPSSQIFGQSCGPVRCNSGPPPRELPLVGGASYRFTVFGIPGQPYFLAFSDSFGCRWFPGIRNHVVLAGNVTGFAAGALSLSTTTNQCANPTGSASVTVTLPPRLPSGLVIHFQGLTSGRYPLPPQVAFTHWIVARSQ